MLTLPGPAERTKFPTTLTASETVVELVKLPLVPVIVNSTLPVLAVPLAVRVKILEVVMGFGLKDAVTPLGRAETDRLTLPPKPFSSVTPMVVVTLDPWLRLKLFGDAESTKPGAVLGQLLTRLAALMVPIPVAKSHPTFVP
jgi:hypothetical protein